jgi:prohibitin 2
MAGNPREQWERLQVLLQNRGRQGGFRFRGLPGAGPVGALVFLGIAGYAISASLFNGSSLFFFLADSTYYKLLIGSFAV